MPVARRSEHGLFSSLLRGYQDRMESRNLVF